MKYLFLLIALGLFFFVLGLKRARPSKPTAPPAPPPPPASARMVSCAHCGLHLPADEALPGRGGVFCSAAHRSSFEDAQGPA